jgi:hypothetical protein
VHPEKQICSFILVLAAAIACADSDSGTTGESDPIPESEQPPSGKARVVMKDGRRMANDLAAALELDRADVCRELGQYDCVRDVHRIALGGVEPYELGFEEPLPVSAVAAPLAAERLALSACATRADRDFDRPDEASQFGSLAAAPESAEARAETVTGLYRDILARDPTESELDALNDLHRDVVRELEDASPQETAREWALLSCFAIATSLEEIFY